MPDRRRGQDLQPNHTSIDLFPQPPIGSSNHTIHPHRNILLLLDFETESFHKQHSRRARKDPTTKEVKKEVLLAVGEEEGDLAERRSNPWPERWRRGRIDAVDEGAAAVVGAVAGGGEKRVVFGSLATSWLGVGRSGSGTRSSSARAVVPFPWYT